MTRRAQLGELVQIDGSPHAWLEGRAPRCTLIAFVDDATSRLLYARFAPAETSRAYLCGLRHYVSTQGRPAAFYSDRHSIFRKHDPEDPNRASGYRELRKRGVSVREAWNTSKSAHGPRRLSKTPALTIALPLSYFTKMGLPSLAAR